MLPHSFLLGGEPAGCPHRGPGAPALLGHSEDPRGTWLHGIPSRACTVPTATQGSTLKSHASGAQSLQLQKNWLDTGSEGRSGDEGATEPPWAAGQGCWVVEEGQQPLLHRAIQTLGCSWFPAQPQLLLCPLVAATQPLAMASPTVQWAALWAIWAWLSLAGLPWLGQPRPNLHQILGSAEAPRGA